MAKHENEAKEEVRDKKGVLLDSVTFTAGSAAKGTAVSLKCYINLLDVSVEGQLDTDTEKKVENMQKLWQKIISMG